VPLPGGKAAPISKVLVGAAFLVPPVASLAECCRHGAALEMYFAVFVARLSSSTLNSIQGNILRFSSFFPKPQGEAEEFNLPRAEWPEILMETNNAPRAAPPERGYLHAAEPCGAASMPAASQGDQLGRRESELWRAALLLLIVLAGTLALLAWDKIRALPHHLEALPVGLVVLVVLFVAYIWSKTREIAELRGLVRGIEQRTAAPPSEKQVEQLFALISHSQQGYRDLIDTFEDLLVAISLEGEIRAANRSFADLLDLPFSEFIGHRLDEFVDAPEGSGHAAAEKALPRLLERRQWSGVLSVRLRRGGTVRHFDCVLHVMVKDERVLGLSVLARDITQQRENETRFTELFETLQEGIYFTTAGGQLLDANPALVRMLG